MVRTGIPPQAKEKVLTGFLIFFFISGFPFSLLGHEGVFPITPEKAQELSRLAWIPIYGLILYVIYPWIKQLYLIFVSNWLLLVLTLLPLVSTVWSISPIDTFRRGIALLICTLLGAYIAERFSETELLTLLARSLILTLGISIVFIVAVPEIGVSSLSGSPWQGIFNHKNHLGRVSLLTILVLVNLLFDWKTQRGLPIIGIVGSVVMLLFSSSVTPVVVGLIVLIAIGFVYWLRLSPLIVVAGTSFFLGILILGGTMLFLYRETVASFFNRDLTFTGRDQIWTLVWEKIQEQFWLGYGFKAFWVTKNGPAQEVWRLFPLDVNIDSAHNGLLEIWLGLGVVGVILFLLSFGQSLFATLLNIRQLPKEEGYWRASYLCLFLVYGFTEAHYYEHHDILWVLFISSLVSGTYQRKWPSPRQTNTSSVWPNDRASPDPQRLHL